MKFIKNLLPLLLALSLFLCSCELIDTVKGAFGNDQSNTTDTNDTDNDKVIAEGGKDYTELDCRVPEAYSPKTFAITQKRHSLTLDLPSDWTFSKNSDGGYDILRDGTKIGNVSYGEIEDDEWISVKKKTVPAALYGVKYSIEKYLYKIETFRHSFEYSYTEDLCEMTVTLTVGYEELDEETVEKLWYEAELKSLTTETNIGALLDIPQNRPVVFIGNSFIGSSQVATIFKEMVKKEGKSLTVTTRSYGGAQLSDFAYNSALVREISSGAFGTVFLCGFYGYSQVDMDVIVDACKQGNATLAVFPAHNENSTSIRIVKMQYPELAHINWKAEIDALIANGVDPLDMYVEDAHHHSTTLAGYVGAQMAYRAIFGEIPTKQLSDTISTSYVKSKLGDYVERGFVYTESFDGILFID